ncbi:MAG: hypothetical protein ACI4LO_07780 [Anaerovoracaceae bacterium]
MKKYNQKNRIAAFASIIGFVNLCFEAISRKNYEICSLILLIMLLWWALAFFFLKNERIIETKGLHLDYRGVIFTYLIIPYISNYIVFEVINEPKGITRLMCISIIFVIVSIVYSLLRKKKVKD